MAKKSESTNEKIVRLYKEGYSFDQIHQQMEIPKGNIIGIVEKYFPEYQTYVQPKINHAAVEEKAPKGKLPFFGRGKKADKEDHSDAVPTINVAMDDEGFLDNTAKGIAQMLKVKKPEEVAEFFNKDMVDILAVKDVMDEHFRRVEAHNAPAEKVEEPEENVSQFATGLESETKPVKRKYTPPTYTKRDDPKPVSAAYGLVNNDDNKPAESTETAVQEAAAAETAPAVNDTADDYEPQIFTGLTPEMEAKLDAEAAKNKDMFAPKDTEPHTISLLPDENKSEEVKEEHKVSLIEDLTNPEIPSIDPVSDEVLETKLKAPEKVEEDIPGISLDEEQARKAAEEAARKAEEAARKAEEAAKKAEEAMKKAAEEEAETKTEETAEEDDSEEQVKIDEAAQKEAEEAIRKAKEDAAKIAEEARKAETKTEVSDDKDDDFDINSVMTDSFKEAIAGMTAMEKMKQFAQEQIAQNNKKIEELKSKKTDAENNAFDCNTKVESMKKKIEEMQAELLTLIAAKDNAAKVVSDINDEIEAIHKENADYNSYL